METIGDSVAAAEPVKLRGHLPPENSLTPTASS